MDESMSAARSPRQDCFRGTRALCCAAALLFAFGACGGDAEAPAAAGSPEAREAKQQAPALKAGKKATKSGKKAKKLAAQPTEAPTPLQDVEIPADIPVYPGARRTEASEIANGGLSASFETRDAAGGVADDLEDALESEGWSVQRIDQPDSYALFADKRDRTLSMVVESKDGKTQIGLIELPVE